MVLVSIQGHRRDHGHTSGRLRTSQFIRPILIVDIETDPQHA